MKINYKRVARAIVLLAVIVITAIVVYLSVSFYISQPKKEASWEKGQEVLPTILPIDLVASAFAEEITIKNLRNFNWDTNSAEYTSLDFKLNEVTEAYVVFSNFSDSNLISHIFFIFPIKKDNDPNQSIAISVESRREKHETYNLWDGLKGEYEVIYTIGTAKDMLGLRKHRKERFRVYKLLISPQQAQKLFYELIKDAQATNSNPQLYHLVFNNCITKINKAIKASTQKTLPKISYVLPVFAEKFLKSVNLINNPSSKEEICRNFGVCF